MNLWGSRHDVPFETARARGLVTEQELRALTLLASLSDPARFGFYLQYGMYPALGNLSKRIYLVRRFETVLETDDGAPVASWCVVTRDRHETPETDHVVALKNIIEGEELAFREIGNRGSFYNSEGRLLGRKGASFPTPFRTPFMEPCEPDSYDPLRLKRQREEAADRAEHQFRQAVERSSRRPWEKREPAEHRIQVNGEAGYIGVAGGNGTARLFYSGDAGGASTDTATMVTQNAIFSNIMPRLQGMVMAATPRPV